MHGKIIINIIFRYTTTKQMLQKQMIIPKTMSNKSFFIHYQQFLQYEYLKQAKYSQILKNLNLEYFCIVIQKSIFKDELFLYQDAIRVAFQLIFLILPHKISKCLKNKVTNSDRCVLSTSTKYEIYITLAISIRVLLKYSNFESTIQILLICNSTGISTRAK